ncbi:nuclear receptor subfamily 2, group F, member 6, isoform CRA_a [Rattus norvegicus]|uniref:Nuclear receptor subfamily 2, group F, member 6, isoform CRA_a n=1 Tax=Rattus norvegicus TaxID=10116 RepID=A6K9S9_RAT|nr:nuclear receptor subfamily 2, group F, member 6, isoform CRA_a [Rattus norvegicus]
MLPSTAASRPSRSSRLMPVAFLTQPMLRACRRRHRWPSPSMSVPSTHHSPSALDACCCGCRPCVLCLHPSSPSFSSCAWWARHPSRRSSGTCFCQGAPLTGPMARASDGPFQDTWKLGPCRDHGDQGPSFSSETDFFF